MSTVNFKKIRSAESFGDALETLNNEIAQVRKEITYLDVYNIVDTVVSQENMAAQINALAPNSSLVVNTAPCELNGVNYARGDIILKNAHSEIIHIPGATGGVYYPKQITADDNGNYTLQYQFTPQDPILNETANAVAESSNSNIWSVSSVVQNINFPLTVESTSSIYGQEKLISDFKVSIDKFNSSIPPVVEFYFCESSDSSYIPVEKIDLEYSITSDGQIMIPSDFSAEAKVLVRVK